MMKPRITPFSCWLRTGRLVPADVLERKFNPNHDPTNGQFTSGVGGTNSKPPISRSARKTPPDPKRYYLGMTSNGVARIQPVSGGYFDATGRYIPELFAPDPYALTDPVTAMAHYVSGTGEPRNYYLNSVDTSGLKTSDFPEIQKAIDDGVPGTYVFDAAKVKDFSSGSPFKLTKLSPDLTVGRLAIEANGTLEIGTNGKYNFDGYLGVQHETFQFYASSRRTTGNEMMTRIGMLARGKSFRVYVIGTKPFKSSGHI